jgi:hypothetical protein
MRAAPYGRHGRRTARTAGAQDRRRRRQHCRTTPPCAAAFRCNEIFHTQLDLFGLPTSADPLLGLAVKLPNTCSKCADLVAIIGPGKPPHSASLLCRSCGLHRGWISRANYTFLNEIINKFGAPTEPIVFRNRSTRPEQNDEGVSVVQVAVKPGGENGNTI